MAALKITSENFDEMVLKSEKPVLVDFWATWCGPCQMQGPIVEDLADTEPSVTVGKINVDEESDLAEKYSVMSIPTLIVFKGGKAVERSVGVTPKEKLLDMLGI